MSAEATLRSAHIDIKQKNFGATTEALLLSLTSMASKPIVQLIYDAAFYATQDQSEAKSRAVCVLYHSTLIHLADDIADGDCNYIAAPEAQGVTAVYTLMHLFNHALSRKELASPRLFELLTRVGAAQHEELACRHWTFNDSLQAAKELNGAQFEAYFLIAASGTQYEACLPLAGKAYGIANHLMNDIQDNDQRFFDLTSDGQTKLVQWALEGLKANPLPFTSSHVYTQAIYDVLGPWAQLNLRC